LERRDLGVDHVVVFVDELNKYAPADGNETYVKKMLLDLSERGRYLGLVLFSAQQFRSQVLRRVVGNAGTGIFGRMDMDELATPGYGTLSPATRIKLATLPKGELMVRHPHFTQPVFLRFPRPPVMSGRDGVERFPPEPDLALDAAVHRHLRQLDRGVSRQAVADAIVDHQEEDILRALNATRRTRPERVLPFFIVQLGQRVRAGEPVRSGAVPPVKRVADPYGGTS
ncbi:MAG: ATP-binding protein, partial [Gemmatimonadales bacterium]